MLSNTLVGKEISCCGLDFFLSPGGLMLCGRRLLLLSFCAVIYKLARCQSCCPGIVRAACVGCVWELVPCIRVQLIIVGVCACIHVHAVNWARGRQARGKTGSGVETAVDSAMNLMPKSVFFWQNPRYWMSRVKQHSQHHTLTAVFPYICTAG